MNESLPGWSLNCESSIAPDAVLVPIIRLLNRLIHDSDFRDSAFIPGMSPLVLFSDWPRLYVRQCGVPFSSSVLFCSPSLPRLMSYVSPL
jgi:hypothetical protein